MRRRTSVRAAAIRRAQEAKQERDARRLVRERQIEAALADFYEQTGRAEQVRGQAQERAARIVAEAEQEAAGLMATAASSVALLEALGEPRAVIAELTGLSLAEVRELLTRAKENAAVTESRPGQAVGVRSGASAVSDPGTASAGNSVRAVAR